MGETLGKKTSNPVSKRLKEVRLAAGISQKKLGIAAGIDQFVASARMNQYETGKHTPDFSILEKIAKTLNIPTAFFYATDDDIADLILKYSKLNISEQTKLIMLLDEMITKKL